MHAGKLVEECDIYNIQIQHASWMHAGKFEEECDIYIMQIQHAILIHAGKLVEECDIIHHVNPACNLNAYRETGR